MEPREALPEAETREERAHRERVESKLWLTLTLAGLTFVLFVVAFVAGRCSAPDAPPTILPDGVDAGPGESELAAQLDAAVRAEEERLARLEEEHAAEIDAFTSEDRAEYEETRRRGRRELAAWFKDRTLRILDAGVTR